jgi:tRNA (mo5U34)-methyltransferase
MLRSAGLVIAAHPEPEVYLCRRDKRPQPDGAVYPVRRSGE